MFEPLPLRSKRTALRPPSPADFEELYFLAATEQVPWLWRGAPETPQAFHELVWRDVLVQFVIEDVRDGRPVGLVSAYNASLFHGYAYVAVTLWPEYQKRVWPLEGVLVFGNYLFTKYSLRHIYSETTERLYDQFRSGAGRLFTQVACFENRLVSQGCTENLYVLGMSREDWETQGHPLFQLAIGSPESAS